MILASIDEKYERLSARLLPAGKKMLVAIAVGTSILVLLNQIQPQAWTLIFIVAAAAIAYGFYLSYKTLYSIAFDEAGGYYEIKMLKGNSISTAQLEKDHVEIKVTRSPGFTMALEIQIIYQQRRWHIQKESALWTNEKITALINLLEQGSFKL